MKSFSKIINESVINFDKIEDVLDNFYDMGFEIINNNDLGSYKGKYSSLFGCDISEVSEYHRVNMWNYSPDENYCYSCFLFSVQKRIRSFSDCDIYSKAIKEAELVRKRLPNCKVFWRLDSNTQGIGVSGGFSDTEINFVIIFYIIDTSRKIEFEEREEIVSFIKEEIKKFKILEYRFYIKWGISDLTFSISVELEKLEEAKNQLERFVKILESKKFSGWKFDISEEDHHQEKEICIINIRYSK